ncbi:MAG: hypothetical protein JST16_14855 [Bdellovibrionales bacterium]|nr:hypothetical protein [Bdellovibrionales bacterium]
MKYLLTTLVALSSLAAAAANQGSIVSTRIDLKYRGTEQNLTALLRMDGKESNYDFNNGVSLKVKASDHPGKDAAHPAVFFAMNLYDTKSGATLTQPQFLVNRDGTRATITSSTKTSESYELSVAASAVKSK